MVQSGSIAALLVPLRLPLQRRRRRRAIVLGSALALGALLRIQLLEDRRRRGHEPRTPALGEAHQHAHRVRLRREQMPTGRVARYVGKGRRGMPVHVALMQVRLEKRDQQRHRARARHEAVKGRLRGESPHRHRRMLDQGWLALSAQELHEELDAARLGNGFPRAVLLAAGELCKDSRRTLACLGVC